MKEVLNYVKPELLIGTVVLYFLGAALKKLQKISDKMIPFILGGAGIFLSALYVFSTCQCHTVQQMMLAVFTSITQGILIAGLSTYINQLFKQIGKTE